MNTHSFYHSPGPTSKISTDWRAVRNYHIAFSRAVGTLKTQLPHHGRYYFQNIPANEAPNRRFSQPIPARTEDRRSITRHKNPEKEPSQHQRKAEVNLRVLLLECLWRGEIEKKRWSPVRRHKRTRTRTRATSSRLVSPAQPSTIFVPRIEVSREPFPCPVATRAIAVRPRSVEKTLLFWHSPASSFCFRTDGALRLDAPSPRGSSHRVPLPSDASVLTYRPSRPVAFATERQVSTKHALTSAAEAAEKVRNSSERGY